jgi:hypothetical protein
MEKSTDYEDQPLCVADEYVPDDDF